MPKTQSEVLFDGPIPGENFTSDTRNYPWHRPPDLTDYDEIVEFMLTTVSDEYVTPAIMSTLEAGATVVGVTDYLMMTHIGKGKFPIDMAILAAGPVARFIQILADDMGVNYDLGTDEEVRTMPIAMVRELNEILNPKAAISMASPEAAPEEPVQELGLGATSGPAPVEEQEAMLGYQSEQTNEEIV